MENKPCSKLKDGGGANGQASLDRKVCVPQPVLGCLDTDVEIQMFRCRLREESTV